MPSTATDAAPRRGRPRAQIDTAKLPPVARVLHDGLAARGLLDSYSGAAMACGIPERTLYYAVAGTREPQFGTLRAILATARPADKDGGWGWFGRQLAALSR